MAVTGNEILARDLAESLPVCDVDDESDLISLCDLIVTGFETGWVHWRTHKYEPEGYIVVRGDGYEATAWAIVEPLSAGLPEHTRPQPKSLDDRVIRDAVTKYALNHLDRGTPLEEVKKLLDGTYTDAPIADAIIQVAIYGEVVFG